MAVETYKLMAVGDLHLSDRYTGKHKDYLGNCIACMEKIDKMITTQGVTQLVVLGDWVGVGTLERNFRELNTLATVIQYLQLWNSRLKGNVYSLRGNHDFGKGLTTFELLCNIGLLKRVDQLDLPDYRFHFFDYGSETRPIQLDDTRVNIGFFHANLTIEGQTTWYTAGDGIELSSLSNAAGISMAVSGHIHNPSPNMTYTSIDGKDIQLFYPGCLTRPRLEKAMWDSAFGVVFTNQLGCPQIDGVTFTLEPYQTVFLEDAVLGDSVDGDSLLDSVQQIDVDLLSQILGELSGVGLNSGMDYASQIDRVAATDYAAAGIAKDYLEKALS